MSAADGREGLARLDEVLARRPQKDGEALSEATKSLCAYREDLIAAARAGGPAERQALDHLNAILSVVAGTHFPLGDVPWEELERARGWLADLIAASPGDKGSPP